MRANVLILWVLLLVVGWQLSASADEYAQVFATESEALLIGQQDSQVLSEHFSIFRNQGDPLTLDQAAAIHREQGFTALRENRNRTTNFGMTRDEIWMRLHFTTVSALPPRWLLEIGYAPLDRVDLYIAQAGDAFTRQTSGDRLAFSAKSIPHRNHVFDVSLAPDRAYTLYLRVASESTLTVPVTLWQPDALWQQDQISYSLLSLFFGLLLALLAYNLFLYLSLRDPLYILYVLFIGTLGIAQAGLAGFTGQFLWPENALFTHLSPTAGGSVAGIFGAFFVQRFLGNTPARLRVQWFMPLIAVGYAGTLLCALFWSYHLAAIAVNLISLVFAAAALIMGAFSLFWRQPGARFFLLAWVSLLSGVIVIALHNLGVLPSNPWTSNALLIGSALEMLLLSLALADRINSLQAAHDAAQMQAISSREQMVAALKESEQQLEVRVAERTRALELSNQRLQESHQLLEHQAGHDTLTKLVNRRLLQKLLAQVIVRAKRLGTGFVLLVADLNKFKIINDTLGHSAGDEVLLEISRRLQAAVRDMDIVARVGGDEFVLLFESVDRQEDAELICRKIHDSVVQPIVLSPGETVRVGVSLGYSIYPEDSRDVETLFQLADQAMYRNKAALPG